MLGSEEEKEVSSSRPVPFLKWAGGKRWLVKKFLNRFPKTYDRYIEPFLGGGSVFFALKPQKSILSDFNARLIETYIQVRDDPKIHIKTITPAPSKPQRRALLFGEESESTRVLQLSVQHSSFI